MRTQPMWACLLIAVVMNLGITTLPSLAAASENDERARKVYTNARFGFSVRYPEDWRLGNPISDGVGVTLHPPVDNSLVALSGHMNVVEGKSQDGRQTLDEFAVAHRRIITELFSKKSVTVTWRKDQEVSLAGFPAKRLTFTYSDDKQGNMIEHHIFSLGRNEGRGIRIKVPLPEETRVMPTITKMLETYQPGRDQNAVSPIVPKEDSAKTAPR